MPIRYDQNLGTNVYDPSRMNEADQGNAMQALARALGFYNEQSDLGTAANFGNPQAAMQALMGLQQAEQHAKQLQNQRDLMAMQQAGNAAVQEARLQQAAQEAQASRAMAKWGKEGDWARYDRQMQTQRDVAESNKLADFMKALYGEQGKSQRATERNATTLQAAQMGADAKAGKITPDKLQRPSEMSLRQEIMNQKKRWMSDPATKNLPMPSDADIEAAVIKKYNLSLGLNYQRNAPYPVSASPQRNQTPVQGVAPQQVQPSVPETPEESWMRMLMMG